MFVQFTQCHHNFSWQSLQLGNVRGLVPLISIYSVSICFTINSWIQPDHLCLVIMKCLCSVSLSNEEKPLDLDTTAIEYQLRQIPRDSGFPAQRWREMFHPLALPVPAFEIPHDPQNGGTREMVAWKMDQQAIHHGAYVKYREYGYDNDGYLCFLGHPSCVFRGGSCAVSSTPNTGGMVNFWKEQVSLKDDETGRVDVRYGREWIFGLNGMRDDSLLSLAALQLCRDVEVAGLCDNSPIDEARRRITKCFVAKFKANWDSEQSRGLWGTSDFNWTLSVSFDDSRWEDLVFQYHMRVFTVNPKSRPLGPNLERSKGRLNLPGKSSHHNLRQVVELRYSVGLKTTWKLEKPVFTLVTVADSTLTRLRDLEDLSDVDGWARAGVQPTSWGMGVAAFAFRIWSLLSQWERHWLSLLNDLEKAFADNINLDVMLSSHRRRQVMIDGSDLELSEFYFAVSSTLRIAAQWIQESMDDLRSTVDDIQRFYFTPRVARVFPNFIPAKQGEDRDKAIRNFKETWDHVISRQRNIGSALLARIDKRQEEIKGLRDGLLNATAVKEATKSTQLNHYILVFTVVTIFYLPLSFVTALFALGFFNLADEPRQTRWFIITTVSVALSTYLFAWLLVWVVQDPSRRQAHLRAYNWLNERMAKKKLP